MPLFEFTCQSCGKSFEFLLGPHDPLPAVCELCGGKLVKKITAPAIQFKGKGWYVTDYAKKSSTLETPQEPKKPADPKTSKPDS